MEIQGAVSSLPTEAVPVPPPETKFEITRIKYPEMIFVHFQKNRLLLFPRRERISVFHGIGYESNGSIPIAVSRGPGFIQVPDFLSLCHICS